jgi:hypothetical protein
MNWHGIHCNCCMTTLLCLYRTEIRPLGVFSWWVHNGRRENALIPILNLIFVWPCIIETNNIDNQLDAKNNGLLIIPISLTCFGQWFRPSSGALDCVYSLWYNAPTMLPAGSVPDYRPATSWVRYTTSCKHSLVLLKMGEIIARNMSSWLRIFNKSLSLHLVGCLYYLFQWCMVKQISNSVQGSYI